VLPYPNAFILSLTSAFLSPYHASTFKIVTITGLCLNRVYINVKWFELKRPDVENEIFVVNLVRVDKVLCEHILNVAVCHYPLIDFQAH